MVKRAAGLALLLLVGACTPKMPVPLPSVGTPKFPEFIKPPVPLAYENSTAAVNESRGWTFLQAGDLKNAEREFTTALKDIPGFYPAEISLGWLELARQNGRGALTHFDKVLQARPSDTAALVGRGDASLSLHREDDALMAFESAVAADPTLADVPSRIEVLKFRALQSNLADARAAVKAGKPADAIRLYMAAIARTPDSAFLYRELAAVERQNGDPASALEHFRKAVQLDATDASSFVQIGELLEAKSDFDGAVAAYSRAIAIEPRPDLQPKIDSAKARADFARLPAEYRAIPDSAQITRGELAALIGVKLATLLQPDNRRPPELITDLRNQWAATWIVSVSRARIMDPYANHAFQPKTVVRRVDLAPIVSRLLARVAVSKPAKAKAWQNARLRFPDLATSHLAYPAASAAIASGVMAAGAGGAFEPTRPVTGSEAIEAIDRLATLDDLPLTPNRGPQ